ncbi:MAG: hypothetical protein Q9221_009133 [Calogaya cf. arnoldii]
MSTLSQLPTELLEIILDRCHLRDLSNLLRSSTTLRQLVLPYLYQDVDFTYAWGNNLTNLHLFVSSILRHPARASFVRKLQITGKIYLPPSAVEARLAEHNLDLAKRILLPERFSSALPRSPGRFRAIQALYLPHIVALALTIVGGVELTSFSPSPHPSGKHFARAGISIFMAVFLLYVFLCLITAININIAHGEKCILIGILAAIPFLSIRILYSVLAVSRDKGKFAMLNGSATAQLGIAIIQEMVVVLVYIGVGVLAPVEEKVQPVEEQPMQRISIARTP